MPSHLRGRVFRAVAAAVVSVLPVTGCSGLFGEKGNSGATDRPGSPAPGAGAAGVGDPLFPSLGNGGYDVTHYVLTLDWSPDGNRLAATAVLTARATESLTAFNLDLHGMDVRSVAVDGAAARGTREGDELTVAPAVPLPAGRDFTAEVVYDGVPDTIVDPDGSHEGWMTSRDGAVALGEPAGGPGWFPGNHTPGDKATYEIAVTVPDGLTAVSNGRLAERRAAGPGRTTFRWRAEEPMASYLAMVAIGRFDVSEGVAAGVPSYVAVDPKTASADTDAVPGLLDRILAWGNARFGPYPFTAAGAVVVDMPGLGYALETQTRAFFDGPPAEATVVHETAHQWFGDAVTPRTWQDMWLNEGFATYAEWLWTEDHGGRSAAETFDDLYAASGPAGQGVWEFPPADPGAPEDVSGTPVYVRGAMVLQKLREAVGDDVFFTILRSWFAEHRYGVVTTADFTALCARLSGRGLDSVFGPWLFEDGKPEA